MLLPPDTMLGRYRILSALGAGGMGEVYLAEDAQLHRRVAIKVLPSDFGDGRERELRFEQEARAASSLNHPNIVTIHEIGNHDGTHFIAMESIDGETLRHKLKAARLPMGEALAISTQVAAALDAAHRSGIVHRDIKPENIMVRKDGLVKVLDFGLAKLMEPRSPALDDRDAPTHTQLRTMPGTMMGTVSYMSPEQARGLEVDARSDIFSFGVVLYELLTGRQPFAGETSSDTIAAILKSEPAPLSPLSEEFPKELERIVGRTLRKDRDERYQHVADLLIDLRDVKRQLESPAVNERDTPVASVRGATIDTQTTPVGGHPARAIKRPVLVAVAALLLLAAGIAASYYWRHAHVARATAVAAAIDSIAVLPFENAARDPAAEYLSDGITESLINRLSQVSNLKVMSSSAVFRYKGKAADARRVGRELNVRAVANGSVNRIGDQLVINVSLDDAADNHRIWGEQYVRKFADILNVQSEIAQEVSSNLRLKLTGEDKRQLAKHFTEDTNAYQLYLKGQYEWKKHTQDDVQKAIGYFNEALVADPNYALAYSGLSACYGVLGNSYVPPYEAFPKAKSYAAKALAIDDTLAQAHLAMGAVRVFYDFDLEGAASEFKRAQALDANNADAHQLYAVVLEARGRFEEARAEARRAQDLDPLSAMFSMEVGATYYYARQYDEAIAQSRKTIVLEPRYSDSYIYLGQAYVQKGLYDRAIETYQAGMTQAERDPKLIAAAGYAYALAGARDKALATLEELREMSKRGYVSPYYYAVVSAGLGDRDQTFAWLDKAVEEHAFWLIWLNVEPQFAALRDDPRFARVLRRTGL